VEYSLSLALALPLLPGPRPAHGKNGPEPLWSDLGA